MSKEYRFCYHGTKEMLFHQCNQGRYVNYVNEYIISTLGGKIEFGIERAGHSDGYWYTPNIIEYEDKIELVGTIQYIGPKSDQGYRSKLKDKIITVLMDIIFFPVVLLTHLIIKLIDFVKWLSAKISKKEKKMKPKTKEEKLFDLMINQFGCSIVENTSC